MTKHEYVRRCKLKGGGCTAGLMVGPAVLGIIADASTVQIALKVNALVLGIAVAYFGIVAKESRHIEERNNPALRAKLAAA